MIKYLKDETGEMEGKSLKIDFNGVNFRRDFSLTDQVEFDIDPRDIEAINDFESIETLMVQSAKQLKIKVYLSSKLRLSI